MRFIVTGGSGFIGYHLVQALLAGEHEVIILDQIKPPAPLLGEGRADIFYGRVEDFSTDLLTDLTGDLADLEPDVIVNLAARAGVRGALCPERADNDMLTNAIGTAHMAHVAALTGAKLIQASSGALYALPEDIRGAVHWYNASSYGISKLAAECYVKLWGAQMDLSWTVLRFSNCYGFQFKPKAVIGSFLKCALEGTQAVIHGDGHQARDFIYVGDLVRCILAVSERERGDHQVLDVATGRDTGIRQVWEYVVREVREAGLDHDIPLPRLDTSTEGGVGGTLMNVKATERDIGWKAQMDLAEGLVEVVGTTVAHCRAMEGCGEKTAAGVAWERQYGDMGLDPIEMVGI